MDSLLFSLSSRTIILSNFVKQLLNWIKVTPAVLLEFTPSNLSQNVVSGSEILQARFDKIH